MQYLKAEGVWADLTSVQSPGSTGQIQFAALIRGLLMAKHMLLKKQKEYFNVSFEMTNKYSAVYLPPSWFLIFLHFYHTYLFKIIQ